MNLTHPRLKREAKTIEAMIHLFCRHTHGKPGPDHLVGLCPDCRELVEYANGRLARCPFQENKSTCAACTVHCFKPEMRQRIKEVMKYAGPHMLYHHPFLAFMHLTVDRFHSPPRLKTRAQPAPIDPLPVSSSTDGLLQVGNNRDEHD